MQTAFLLLGSNLGDRAGNLADARSELTRKIGRIDCLSSVYETEPWGMKSARYFYNQCATLSTSMDPFVLMKQIRSIEKDMGKTQSSSGYADRTIDIDILFFGDMIINERDLIIPHPKIRERRFAMIPILEIYPDFVYPPTGKKLREILDSCGDTLSVIKMP